MGIFDENLKKCVKIEEFVKFFKIFSKTPSHPNLNFYFLIEIFLLSFFLIIFVIMTQKKAWVWMNESTFND